MPKQSADERTELLRTLVIIQLGLAGIPAHSIRKIAGCDMNRVTKILKELKPKRKPSK